MTHTTRAGWKRILGGAAMLLAAGGTPGCHALDALTERMVAAGILMPTRTCDAGLPQGAVVEVVAGAERGVGVCVEDGLIMTANHVVGDRARVAIVRPSEIAGAVAAREVATVVWRDAAADVALLRTDIESEGVAAASPAGGGAWLVTLEQGGTSILGTPTRRAHVRRAEVDAAGRFTVSGGVRPGDSGSPLLQDGRVVGVVRTATKFASAAPAAVAVAALRGRGKGGVTLVALTEGRSGVNAG